MLLLRREKTIPNEIAVIVVHVRPYSEQTMYLKSIRLTDFRAHERTECTFVPSVNLLYGPNGAGKTNILDAIHYACLSRGFVAAGDRYIVRRGAKHTEVEGAFVSDDERDRRVRMAYVPGEGKRMFVNKVLQERMSRIVGRLPVVSCAPQDYVLTSGGPDHRRRFIDNLLSQGSSLYLDALLKFRRALKQRNRYLADMKGSESVEAARPVLSSWDEQLILFGSQIVEARQRFTEVFTGYLDRAYQSIEDVAEKPTMEYQANLRFPAPATLESIQSVYREKLTAVLKDECRRGTTLAGPHLDDLAFHLDDMLVRRYASQGQHRTFGMALKLAMYDFLQERTGERPILLLDDVFEHLDASRTEAFLDLLQSDRIGQTIISATDRRPFDGFVPFGEGRHQVLFVEGGQVHMPSSVDLGG